MLKKAKRTLSLVLALIIVCSAMSIMAFAAENATAAYEMGFTIHWYDLSENFYIMVDGPYSASSGFSRFDGVVVEMFGLPGYEFDIPIETSDRIVVEITHEGSYLCIVTITIGNNGLPSARVSTYYNCEVLGPSGTLYT